MTGEPLILIPTPSGWMAVSVETFRKGLDDAKELVDNVSKHVDKEQGGSCRARAFDAKLIDARKAAKLFGVKPSWLLRRARERRIPCIRLGKHVRFNPDEIRAALQNNTDRHANFQ